MRLFLAFVILTIAASGASAASMSDCAGVVRVFGDAGSWMSSCFVVGDGSWVVTTRDAIVEKVGPKTEQTIRRPIFISAYNGRAYQCEVKAQDKELNIALLKLPVSGLPSMPLAQLVDFSKAAYGTMGQLMSGDPIGNKWLTEIYGVTRTQTEAGGVLGIGQWKASQVFVCEVGNYKMAFLSELSPDNLVPNGAAVVREGKIVGMYLNKLRLTGGKEDVVYGRCAISPDIAAFLSKNGIDTSTLYNAQTATVKRDENSDAVFQLQAVIYSVIGAGKPEAALDAAQMLVKVRADDAQALMVMGLAQIAGKQFEEAIKTFDKAAEIDPKLSGLRMNRALAFVGLEKREEAEKELLKAVEETPGDVRPVSALADFYLGDDETYDKALQYAKKAVTMAPESPAALLLAAQVEKRQKAYSAAVTDIMAAITMAPKWGEAYYALGSTCEDAGEYGKAEQAYRRLVEIQPQNPGALLTLASFLADRGKNDEAKAAIDKLRALNPPEEVLKAAQTLEDKVEGKSSDTE